MSDTDPDIEVLLLAMEFVEGANARVWLHRAARLVAAHDAAIVHRDIKPENIMVDSHGVPRVVDFGLARPAPTSPAASAGPGHTQFGTITGTLEYMAPEARRLLAGDRGATHLRGLAEKRSPAIVRQSGWSRHTRSTRSAKSRAFGTSARTSFT